jgi:hypothetical protein
MASSGVASARDLLCWSETLVSPGETQKGAQTTTGALAIKSEPGHSQARNFMSHPSIKAEQWLHYI